MSTGNTRVAMASLLQGGATRLTPPRIPRARLGARRPRAARARAIVAKTGEDGGGVGQIKPFKLERWFAQYEFSAPYLLCCSDCEALTMQEVLDMADEESLEQWNSLSLGYTEAPGLPALREEIARMYDTAKPSDVIVTVPEEGIYLTMLALLKPGDHVIVTYPGYQSLYEVAVSIGCTISLWQPEATPKGLKFQTLELMRLMTDDTKLVAVNFPHNPTGFMPTPAVWNDIVDVVAGVGAHLFCDEMYRGFELNGNAQLLAGVDSYKKAISLCGMSKVFAMPGTRIGWIATHDKALLTRIGELKDYTTICSSAPSEMLALMGLRAREKIIERNMGIMQSNLEILDHFFRAHTDKFKYHPPMGSTIVFPELITGEPSDAFCSRLVEEQGILLLPGAAVDYLPKDGRQHLRIGFGRRNMPEIMEMLDAYVRS